MTTRIKDLHEHLFGRCELRPSGCLEWTGYRMPFGHGMIRCPERRRMVLTHRMAWELQCGPIPSGLVVCHHCDNPPCCNVEHLFLGTQADNVRDMKAKGRERKRALHGTDSSSAKLTEEQVLEIRARHIPRVMSYSMLAREYGVTIGAIQLIIERRNWKHI